MVDLYDRLRQPFKSFERVPICTELSEVKEWLAEYQCKVAID